MRVAAVVLLLVLPVGLVAQRGLPTRPLAGPVPLHSQQAWLRRPGLPDTARVRGLRLLARELKNTNLDSARQYAEQGVALARRIRDGRGEAYGEHGLATIYYLSGNYPAAQRSYEAALAAARQAHLCAVEGRAYMGQGLVADAMGNVPAAIAYLEQARAVFAACQPPEAGMELAVLTNMGNTYLQAGQIAKSERPLRQALRLLTPGTGPDAHLNLLDLIGLLQLAQQHPDSAVATWQAELRLARAAPFRRAETYALGNLARARLQQGQPVAALAYARQAVGLARQTGNQAQVADFTLVLAQALHGLHQPSAFDTLMHYTVLHDTLVGQARNEAIARLQVRFDVASQQARIRALEQQRRIGALEAAQRRFRSRVGLAALSAAFLLLGGLGLWRYRRRQAAHDAALRTRIAADLHDDVGSLLTQISLETELLRDGLYTPDEQPRQLHRLVDASRTAVRHLNDVVWGLDARYDSMADLLDRLRDHAYEVLPPKGLDIDFAVTPEIEASTLPLPARQALYLIYKEALHNVVKHATGATLAHIALRLEHGHLVLSVADDGHPAEASSGRHGNGHGLGNMAKRAAEAGGSSQSGPAPAGGFVVEVRLPLG